MDFSEFFQKKSWWIDVVFYFVISLLISTLFCYATFFVKNIYQKKDIDYQDQQLKKVGTSQQLQEEKEVINYKSKIEDFFSLLNNHELTSNAFMFMQKETMPNIWFDQFALNKASAALQMTGESDDLDSFSRQVSVFEKNKYIKSITTLSSTLGNSARMQFNMNIAFNKDIFSYLSDLSSISAVETPSVEPIIQTETSQTQAVGQTKSNEKLIISFHVESIPETEGMLDQNKFTVSLDVPFGTDVKNLSTSIITSPGATIFSNSGAPQDFTNPVIYVVTAEDGSTQDYKVTVKVLPKENTGNNLGIIITVVVVILVIILVSVSIVLKRNKKLKEVVNASR